MAKLNVLVETIPQSNYSATITESLHKQFMYCLDSLDKAENLEDAILNLDAYRLNGLIPHFIFGKGGNHVWISTNDKRNVRVIIATEKTGSL